MRQFLILLAIGIMTQSSFGQRARQMFVNPTNNMVEVPESGFWTSNQVPIIEAIWRNLIPVVDTMADLRARTPSTNYPMPVGVRKFDADAPFRTLRFFTLDVTNATPRDGYHVETNAAGIGRYVSLDRLNAIQPLENFGVAANGTDMSERVQNAIHYCYSNNVPVLDFPAGTTVISNVTFTGTGLIGGLTFQGADGLRSIVRGNAAATMFTLSTLRKVTIQNLWIDGNDVSTNLVSIDNSTEFLIRNNDFYRANGRGVWLKGPQNYGHLIQFNNFINNHEVGLDVNGGSTTANTIHRNKFEAPGWTNAIGIRVAQASANHDYTANVFQSLRFGLFFEGGTGGQQIQNSIDQNYFEVFTDVPIGLGPGQHNNLSITRNYFYQDFTTGGWCVRDTNGCIIYGFVWEGNAITSDSGKALSLTNSLSRAWKIKPGPADIATDYQLPTGASLLWETPGQRLASFIYTNYDASASTNFLMAGDLVPNLISIGSTSNIAVNLNGFTYTGTEITLRNHGANNVVFTPTSQLIFPGQEEHFLYTGSGWQKMTLPYLPDYVAATMRGNFGVNSNLTVSGTSGLNGTVTLGGALLNPHGYLSSGTFGGTNLIVLGANSNALAGIIVNGFYYVIVGTNGTTRFESDVVIAPNKGINLGGVIQTNWPSGGGGSGTLMANGSGSHSNIADSADITIGSSNGTMRASVTSTTGTGAFVRANSPSGLGGTWGFDGMTLGILNVSTQATAPTASLGTSNTTVATTAYSLRAIADFATNTPTASALSSNKNTASTEYVDKAIAAATPTSYFVITVGYGSAASLSGSASPRFAPSSTRTYAQATAYDYGKVIVPVKCKIIGLSVRIRNSTTSTNGAISTSFRTNDIGDVTIGSFPWLGTGDYSTNFSGIDAPLNAGDSFAIKYTSNHSDSPSTGGWWDVYLQPIP